MVYAYRQNADATFAETLSTLKRQLGYSRYFQISEKWKQLNQLMHKKD